MNTKSFRLPACFVVALALFYSDGYLFTLNVVLAQDATKDQTVKVLQSKLIEILGRNTNTRIEVTKHKSPSDESLLEQLDLSIGKSVWDQHLIRWYFDPENLRPRIGTIIAEKIFGGGQTISLSQTDAHPPMYFSGTVDIKPTDDLPFTSVLENVLFFGIYLGGPDAEAPQKSPDLKLESTEQSRTLTISQPKVVVSYHFPKSDDTLESITVQRQTTRGEPTGKKNADGDEIYTYKPFTEILSIREIKYNADKSRVIGCEVGVIEKDKFHLGSVWKIQYESLGEDVVFTPFKFRLLPLPPDNSVVVDGSGSEHQLIDGRIVRVIDESAVRVQTEIREQLAAGQSTDIDDQGSEAIPSDIIYGSYLRSSSSRHCGVYSAVVAAELLGKEIHLETLPMGDYISSVHGSTAEDIVRLLREQGLHGFLVTNADSGLFQRLADWDCVAILHFGASLQVEGVAHWAVTQGLDSDGRLIVIDLPRGPEAIEVADLLTTWDGTAIVVSKRPVTLAQRLASYSGMATNVALVFTVLIVGLVLQRRFWNSKRVVSQASVLGLIALAFTLIWHYASPQGFANNPFAVKLTRAKVITADALNKTVAVETLELDEETAVVDARLPIEYKLGHIPGAINLPIDFSIGELSATLATLKGKQRLYVYCNNDKCGWANMVAAKLALFHDQASIQVYKPGYTGYLESQGYRMQRKSQ